MAEGKRSEVLKGELDFLSSSFNALRALYTTKLQPPVPNAYVFNNINEYANSLTAARNEAKQSQSSDLARRLQDIAENKKPRSRNRDPKRFEHLMKVKSQTDGVVEKVAMLEKTKKKSKHMNVLERMEVKYKEGPFSILYNCINKKRKLRVWTRKLKGLRGVCVGYLIAFDKHMNLAMMDVDEMFAIEEEVLVDPKEPLRIEKRKEKKRKWRRKKRENLRKNAGHLVGSKEEEQTVENARGNSLDSRPTLGIKDIECSSSDGGSCTKVERSDSRKSVDDIENDNLKNEGFSDKYQDSLETNSEADECSKTESSTGMRIYGENTENVLQSNEGESENHQAKANSILSDKELSSKSFKKENDCLESNLESYEANIKIKVGNSQVSTKAIPESETDVSEGKNNSFEEGTCLQHGNDSTSDDFAMSNDRGGQNDSHFTENSEIPLGSDTAEGTELGDEASCGIEEGTFGKDEECKLDTDDGSTVETCEGIQRSPVAIRGIMAEVEWTERLLEEAGGLSAGDGSTNTHLCGGQEFDEESQDSQSSERAVDAESSVALVQTVTLHHTIIYGTEQPLVAMKKDKGGTDGEGDGDSNTGGEGGSLDGAGCEGGNLDDPGVEEGGNLDSGSVKEGGKLDGAGGAGCEGGNLDDAGCEGGSNNSAGGEGDGGSEGGGSNSEAGGHDSDGIKSVVGKEEGELSSSTDESKLDLCGNKKECNETTNSKTNTARSNVTKTNKNEKCNEPRLEKAHGKLRSRNVGSRGKEQDIRPANVSKKDASVKDRDAERNRRRRKSVSSAREGRGETKDRRNSDEISRRKIKKERRQSVAERSGIASAEDTSKDRKIPQKSDRKTSQTSDRKTSQTSDIDTIKPKERRGSSTALKLDISSSKHKTTKEHTRTSKATTSRQTDKETKRKDTVRNTVKDNDKGTNVYHEKTCKKQQEQKRKESFKSSLATKESKKDSYSSTTRKSSTSKQLSKERKGASRTSKDSKTNIKESGDVVKSSRNKEPPKVGNTTKRELKTKRNSSTRFSDSSTKHLSDSKNLGQGNHKNSSKKEDSSTKTTKSSRSSNGRVTKVATPARKESSAKTKLTLEEYKKRNRLESKGNERQKIIKNISDTSTKRKTIKQPIPAKSDSASEKHKSNKGDFERKRKREDTPVRRSKVRKTTKIEPEEKSLKTKEAKVPGRVVTVRVLKVERGKALVLKRRHINQLFIRGDEIIMVACENVTTSTEVKL